MIIITKGIIIIVIKDCKSGVCVWLTSGKYVLRTSGVQSDKSFVKGSFPSPQHNLASFG